MGNKRIGLARTQALIEGLKRELQMDSTMKGALTPLVTVTAAQELSAEQSGATIYWTHSVAHDLTLPTATAGLQYTFILLAGAAANHHIVTQSADKIFGRATVTSTTDDQIATQVVLKASGKNKIHLHRNVATTGGNAGDIITLVCAEDGYWVCNTNLSTLNATPASIATLTD